jgi:hypothetical protein
MAVSHSSHPPPRHVRRRASLPAAVFLLLWLCLLACSTAQQQDEQQPDDLEAALTDIDAAAITDQQSALELEENTLLKPQTEWRSHISSDAAHAFSAAVAAQLSIQEVQLQRSRLPRAFTILPPALLLTPLKGIAF